jgi:hypothetical protein
MMQPDPTIDRIREARRQISEQCGHDPRKLVEYYRRLEQETYAHRLITARQRTAQKDSR